MSSRSLGRAYFIRVAIFGRQYQDRHASGAGRGGGLSHRRCPAIPSGNRSAHPFRFVPNEHIEAAVRTLELWPGIAPTSDQLTYLRTQLGADLVIVGNFDYGKIRWQYRVPGLVLSMLAETLIVGAATGFNPAFMAATAGRELLTDVPFWWGGAYIAGWAFRPVRVEASAIDPLDGAVVWDEIGVCDLHVGTVERCSVRRVNT